MVKSPLGKVIRETCTTNKHSRIAAILFVSISVSAAWVRNLFADITRVDKSL